MTPTTYLLDSGILISMLRLDLRAFRLVGHLTERGTLATTSVCAFEVLRGCRSEQQEARTDRLLSGLEIVALDIRAGRTAARIARLNRAVFGSTNTVPDALIAGCSVERAATLVTLNRRQFSDFRYPALEMLVVEQDGADWTAGIA